MDSLPTTSELLELWPYLTRQEREELETLLQSTPNPWAHYRKDPVGFIEKELKTQLTADQKAIAQSVLLRSETNVQAAHGVGKTRLAALLVLWFVFAVEGTAITTAPTENQVKELLWSEIRKAYDKHRAKLGGHRTVMTLHFTEIARAYGFTAREYSPDAFQGKHAEKLLLIEDEANGISQEIDDGATSCVTGSDNRLLRIGNPVTDGTPFAKSCKLNHIRVSVWTHPNVSWAYELHSDGIHRLKPAVAEQILKPPTQRKDDPVIPQAEWPPHLPRDIIPGAVSIAWIEKIRVKKGEASAYWQSRVEGIFPQDSADAIVPRSWFLAARARYDANPSHWNNLAQKHSWKHGLDVGDGGDDHALASCRGPVLYAVTIYPTRGDGQDVARAADIGRRALLDHGGSVGVDNTGVGAGTLAILLREGREAHGVRFGGGVSQDVKDDPAQPDFGYLKDELFWQFREGVRTGEIAIAPLGEAEEYLMDDLANSYYEETPQGKTRMEPKKKTIKRLGRSPNAADAVVMAYHGAGSNSGFDSLFDAY